MIEQSNANSDDPKDRSSLISLIVKYYLTQLRKNENNISWKSYLDFYLIRERKWMRYW